MKILNLVQGSEDWQEMRKAHFGASEAPAMMGVSKHMSRNDLLKQKKTGVTPDVSSFQQKIFNDGHNAEAMARQIAEKIIGEELYPVTGVSEDHPELLASLDGQTMLGDVIWEHKHINATLRACWSADDLPEMYKVQMDQQLLVSGAEKCLFMASDGTENDMISFFYTSTEERFNNLVNGWKQFKADLASYEVKEEKAVVAVDAIESLPSLNIKLTGAVSASNLPEFKTHAIARIDSINTDLQTDEDFATAKQMIKFLKSGENQLKAAKKKAISETASIDEMLRTIDDLDEYMRQKRLTLEKLVKSEEQVRKAAIVNRAKSAYSDWLGAQECPVSVDHIVFDPAAAIKGKRNIEDAADDALASAKVAAKQEIDRIKQNANLFNAQAKDFEFLFADKDLLLVKQADDLVAVISARIAEHKQREKQAQEQAAAQAAQEKEQESVASKPEVVAQRADSFEHDLNEWASGYAVSDAALKSLRVILNKYFGV